MTAKEVQKRNAKSNQLRVLESDEGQFFVEISPDDFAFSVGCNMEKVE